MSQVLENVFKQRQKLSYMRGAQEGISRGTKGLLSCSSGQDGAVQLCILETALYICLGDG